VIFRTLLPIAAVLLSGALVHAQGTQVGLQGGADHDSSLPVEVTSQQLDVDETGGTAIFTGDVIVTQGLLRLTGPVVNVWFMEGPDGENEIEKVYASGGVTLFNGLEAAEGEDALYTLATGTVVMTGDVVLTQGLNAIAGEKLTVNLDTSTGVMEGRVKVLYQSGSAGDGTE
jgi:lipopolysaccharide export system protein LptA